jgi:uncharacterized protein YndB with AHSA1/START domain
MATCRLPTTLRRMPGVGNQGVAMEEPVTRSIELDATPAEVWRALTQASLLSDWFEAEAEI